MAYEAAQDIVREFCNVSDAELSNANINWLHLEIANRFTELESELDDLRQVVADVETCRNYGIGVTVFCDDRMPDENRIALVHLRRNCVSIPLHASTWQAALHAAAEHVRREAQGPPESSSVT